MHNAKLANPITYAMETIPYSAAAVTAAAAPDPSERLILFKPEI